MPTMRMQAPFEWSSTLSSGITDSATTVTVSSATGLPSKGFFYVTIRGEICLVTKVSGTTLTIVRAQEGTVAEAHSGGTSIKSIVCKGTFEGFRREAGAIKCLPYGRIQRLAADGTLTTLTAADWIQYNTATGSGVSDGNDGIITLLVRDHSGNDTSGIGRIFTNSSDWRITAHIGCPAFLPSSPDILSFYSRQQTGGSLTGISLYPKDSVRAESRATFLAAPSTDNSHGVQGICDIWVRLEMEWDVVASTDHLRYYYSIDGVHWWLMYTYTFASSSIQTGLWMTNITGTIASMRAHIFSWLEEEVTF